MPVPPQSAHGPRSMGVGPEARVGMANECRHPALESDRYLHSVGRGRVYGLPRRLAVESGISAREGGESVLTWPGRAIGRRTGEPEQDKRARPHAGGGAGARTTGRRARHIMNAWARFSHWLRAMLLSRNHE